MIIMKKILKNIKPSIIYLKFSASILFLTLFIVLGSEMSDVYAQNTNVQVSVGALGFKIPDFATILTFAIRFFFVIAGIAALIFGLFGAFSWVISGGEQEAIDAARKKIVAALVGVILIVVVLAAIVTFEQFIFQQRVCFGLSCPVVIPGILEACVPNPQFQNNNFANSQCAAASANVKTTNTNECCDASTTGIRTTTGWSTRADVGKNGCKVCCTIGDSDGDQVCD